MSKSNSTKMQEDSFVDIKKSIENTKIQGGNLEIEIIA